MENVIIIKPDPKSYIIPLGLVFFSSIIIFLISSGRPDLFITMLIPIIILSLILINSSFWKILIDENKIIFKTLFKTSIIPFSRIKKIGVKIADLNIDSFRRNSFYSLILHDISDATNNIDINMKPFAEKDLAFVIKKIKSKTPNVEMDDYSTQLGTGDTRQISSKGIRSIIKIEFVPLAIYSIILIIIATIVRVLKF